jgi:hypothetical protein
MSVASVDLVIEQGKTFQRTIRWETAPLVYKAISAHHQGRPGDDQCERPRTARTAGAWAWST